MNIIRFLVIRVNKYEIISIAMTHVKSLAATDISQIAVERTAQRCAQFSHVDCRQLDMVADALPGQFDLIVCSEVLYYIGEWKALKSMARKSQTLWNLAATF